MRGESRDTHSTQRAPTQEELERWWRMMIWAAIAGVFFLFVLIGVLIALYQTMPH